MTTVLIRGEGIAGSCCARLLDQAGLQVCVAKVNRPKLPAIMMGEITQKLLMDVFETQDLSPTGPQLQTPTVLWVRTPWLMTLPHSAVVVSEQVLLTRVQQQLERIGSAEAAPDWTVFASTALQPSSVECHFGSRMAAASAVQLRLDSDIEACWIESVENGWLFLLPGAGRSGWLLSVGDGVDALTKKLADSRSASRSASAKRRVSVSSPDRTTPGRTWMDRVRDGCSGIRSLVWRLYWQCHT